MLIGKHHGPENVNVAEADKRPLVFYSDLPELKIIISKINVRFGDVISK